MSKSLLKVGCDPELFIRTATGEFMSGHGLIPGTKNEPFKVKSGAVQVDGTALEFNTDPADSCAEFLSNINTVMGEMQRIAGADRIIVAEPVAEYSDEYFKTLPEEAVMLGCNPDFNAWTLSPNEPPNAEVTFRTGSGHIHMGWMEGADPGDYEHIQVVAAIMRQMDYYVGIATLLWDTDPRRRELYGKAGAFRPKSYGGEYRVPSNRWLVTKETQEFVYYATVKAYEDIENGYSLVREYRDLARTIIDENQTDWMSRYPELVEATGLDYSKVA